MKRRSKAGGKISETDRRKAATRKRSIPPKAVPGRRSTAVTKETEIARLTRERDEALEREKVSAKVLRVISSSPGELKPVFDAILANAVRLCEASYGAMWLPEEGGFRNGAFYGELPEAYTGQWRSGMVTQARVDAPMDRIARSRKPVHVADLRADRSYLEGHPLLVTTVDVGGIRTYLGVPMLKAGDLVGVIAIYRTEVRPFTDKQIELVKNFAAQAVIAIENTRLLNELRESLQQQTATADVLKIVSRSTFDLQSVLDTLVQSAVQLCDAECAHIFQFTDEGYRLAACCGYSREYEDYMRARRIVPGRHTLIGRVAIEGGVVHIPDVLADPEYQWAEAQKLGRWRTMLGVPLLREGSPIGALSLTRSTVKPFTEKQIELLTTFADQAVIAIENVRLFEAEQQRTRELGESLEQQTATSEVLSVISSSPGDMKPVFEAILANALRICEAKFGHILLYDGERYHASHLHDVPPSYRQFWEQHGPIRPGPNTGLARLARTKQIAHIPDLKADPVYAEREPLRVITVDQAGARTLLAVPMVKDDQLIGAIIIYRQEVQPFADEQIELVKNFAAQAVIAIENTRLLNELRQSLQQQTATADVLKVISRSAFDLKHVFETVAESAVKLCDADKAFIFRFDGKLLHAIVAFNASQELREFLENNPIRPGRYSGAGRAALERRTIHIPDVLVDPEYTYGSRDVDSVRTVLTVPMLKGDDLLGVILIYRLEVKPFTDNQISLIETFADQAAIAVENVRLLSELRESLQQQTATADVLKVISRSTFDLQTVLQTHTSPPREFAPSRYRLGVASKHRSRRAQG
jgi:two-component system, NtrC family, sensor kinase